MSNERATIGAHGVIKYHTVALSIGIGTLSATELSAGREQCTGSVAQLTDEVRREPGQHRQDGVGGRLTIPNPGQT